MIYFHKLLLKADKTYTAVINSAGKMSAIFVAIALLPYGWLILPLLLNDIGPTGWNVYEERCKPYFFCGFKNDRIIYSFFWALPLILVFVTAYYFSR